MSDTHIEAEIATQPRNWLDAREVAARAPVAAAPARRARGRGRLRHVVLHGSGVRRAARGGRARRHRRLDADRGPAGPRLRPRRGDHPVRHHHRGAGPARRDPGTHPRHRDHLVAGHPGARPRGADPDPRGRRGVGGADAVRDHHAGDAALAPRRGPDRGRRRRPRRCSTPPRARWARPSPPTS